MGPRVLLGNLEPIVRLGMEAVLRENGAEIVDDAPDAVVLDIADGSSSALAARIRRSSPEAIVVLWARDEEVMEVHAAGASEPRRVLSPDPDELCRALVRT
jgi:DNA-binding NarL/FixJ family response regulator